jgi:hypothetical protein
VAEVLVADEVRLYVEPPIPTTTEFSTVEQVRSVIVQHLAGRFRMSALLAERMGMNPRFRGVLNTRLAGFAATTVEFLPARDNRDGRRAAREFGEDWPQMVSTPIRKQFREWSLLLGNAFAQRASQLHSTSGRRIFKVSLYWPGFVTSYWAEGGYRIQTYDAGVIDVRSPGHIETGVKSPMGELVNPSRTPWIVDEPNGPNSWRKGMIAAAWRPWLGHEWSMRDQARGSEKHGLGIFKAKYPRGQGPEHKAAIDRYVNGLITLPSEGVIPLEQPGETKDGQQIPGFDVDTLEFNGTGFTAISDTMNANAVALAILFLGHNLTTEIKGGGSYAAAGVGEYIRDDIKGDDTSSEWGCFGPQLARPYCLLNYGDPELAPRARYIVDSTAVNRAISQMYQAIAAAIQILRANVPRFDVDGFCEQWRIPLLPVGSVQVPSAAPPPPAGKESQDDDTDEDDEEEKDAA